MYRLIKISLLIQFCVVCAIHAQAPDWTVNPADYQYSMTVVAFLNVEGKTLTEEQNKVAAFTDGQVRGVTHPIYVASADRYLAYLTIYANKEGEPIEFMIYDSTGDKVVPVDTMLNFSIDEQYGNVFQAFSLANPALSNKAEIENFYFTDVDSISTVIGEEQVDIVVEYDQDLTALTPEFKISNGARMYINRNLQESGAATIDFSDAIGYSVLSEDESVLKNYQVTVTNRQVSGTSFYSTNVITANNDGENDYWVVQDAFKYSNNNFKIFDANGRILMESVGYNNDWDGTLKGNRVERGKYYFVVEDPETGTVIKGHILVLY